MPPGTPPAKVLAAVKATLRAWRQDFARHLREHGVAANATERAVRGAAPAPKRDGVYRVAERGMSVRDI